MAHDTKVLNATRMVAARTRYEPKAICGTKSNTSIRKESRQTIKSMILRMNTRSRYLEEWEGE
jgi:hypothetical protein